MELTAGRDVLLAFVVFVAVFSVYFASDNVASFDSKWSVPGAMSLIRNGDLDLNEFASRIPDGDYSVEEVDGHIYSVFPIGATLLSLPVLWAVDLAGRRMFGYDVYAALREQPLPYLELFVASVIGALVAAFVFLISRRLTRTRTSAVVLTATFALGTSAWSSASRSLGRHGATMLAIAGVVLILVLARDRPRALGALGVPVAFAYVSSASASVVVICVTAWLALRHRSQLIPYLAGAAAVGVPFVAYNVATYGSLFPNYYLFTRLAERYGVPAWNRDVLGALAANLFSPARGLVVFTPVLLLCVPGIRMLAKRRALTSADACIASIIALSALTIAIYHGWWGGHSFGPRLFSDLLPFAVIYLAPVVDAITRPKGHVLLTVAFVLAGTAGGWIHYNGASSWSAYLWNSEPLNVDFHHQRVWDWRDAQFLRRGDLPSSPP